MRIEGWSEMEQMEKLSMVESNIELKILVEALVFSADRASKLVYNEIMTTGWNALEEQFGKK